MGFQTPQYRIGTLLDWASSGYVQLPDFQREYKWDDDRIRELLVTIVRGHPMGVIMVLETGSDQIRFKPKPLAGVEGPVPQPHYLLLDGQQRMTSLYQALTGDGVVNTEDARKRKMQRRYFLDIEKVLGGPSDQDDAVISVPADGKVKENFDRDVVFDYSTTALQQEQGVIPFTALFGSNLSGWMLGYLQAVPALQSHRIDAFTEFNNKIAVAVVSYEIPAIELDKSTSKGAVATVFEKVNSGGLALNTFELLTATFAGDAAYYEEFGEDFRLGDDWLLTESVLVHHPVLSDFQKIDFLQAVALLATLRARRADVAAGKAKPSATSARKEDILRLDLREYLEWAPKVRDALTWVAQFYTSAHIHEADFLPYRTLAVPLSVFRVLLGSEVDTHAVKQRLRQWYWCGVLGELYGSATETRFAREAEQVPAWAAAGVSGEVVPAPDSVQGSSFVESRLLSLRTRGSAAYKGVYALLMTQHCKDWKLDQYIDHATYLEQQIDIHHIFPKAWCGKNDIAAARRESIINKTPLAKRTNIFLGGESPANYVPRLEKASGLVGAPLDEVIRTHLIDPALLRSADFDAFFSARREALLGLIESAMGKPALRDVVTEDGYAHGLESPEAFEDEVDDVEDEGFAEAEVHDQGTEVVI
jgi:hypothetical protein